MYPLSTSTLSISSNQFAKPLQKILMSGYFPAVYGPLTHMILPAKISYPISYWRRKSVSWDRWSLMWDAHISAIYTDETVVQSATIIPAFKTKTILGR
jgi:hypothetical protein